MDNQYKYTEKEINKIDSKKNPPLVFNKILIETYTFSRALHLMRYGGKKMKPINWNGKNSNYFCVVEDDILEVEYDCKYMNKIGRLSSNIIMGSWVEVK